MIIVRGKNSFTGEVKEINDTVYRLLGMRPDSQAWTLSLAAQIFAGMGFDCDIIKVVLIL